MGGGPPNITSAIGNVRLWSFFVDPTMSTEKRYSADIFSSYADDYLWFTSYDADVGTFLFLGGYPSDGSDVDSTLPLTPTSYTISFGLGKTTKIGYFGLYFGGNLVDDAWGTNNGLSGDDKQYRDYAQYTNSIAILYGNKKYGAFRLDMYYGGTTYNDYYVSDKPSGNGAQTVTAPPSIAIGYGREYKGYDVYAQLGYRFGTMTVNANADGSKKDTIWGTSRLALQAGLYKALKSSDKSESSVSADFLIGNVFGASQEGNISDVKYTRGGIFVLGADVAYKQIIKADDKLSFGFKPNATIGFAIDDTNSVISGDGKFDAVKTAYFELAAGINFGIKYQINQKFALYSGVGFDIFDLRTYGNMDGKDAESKASAWRITGINARAETLHDGTGTGNNNLGFGLTFAPTKNISIGAGLNTILDRIIYFDVTKMQLGTGFDKDSNDGSELGWVAANLISGLTFDLTITAKF